MIKPGFFLRGALWGHLSTHEFIRSRLLHARMRSRYDVQEHDERVHPNSHPWMKHGSERGQIWVLRSFSSNYTQLCTCWRMWSMREHAEMCIPIFGIKEYPAACIQQDHASVAASRIVLHHICHQRTTSCMYIEGPCQRVGEWKWAYLQVAWKNNHLSVCRHTD